MEAFKINVRAAIMANPTRPVAQNYEEKIKSYGGIHAKRIAAGVSGPVMFLPLEDAGHVANNRTYRYRLQSADWMADILCG